MNMLLKRTDFFAQLLRGPEDETGSGETPAPVEETDSLLDGEGDDDSPKSLLDGDTEGDEGEGEGEGEGSPSPELNKDEVIKSLGEDFVVQDQEKLDAFFDLLANERDPNKIAENALKMLSEVTTNAQTAFYDDVSKQWNDTQKDWQKQTREHPEFGGEKLDKSLAAAKEVALKFGGNDFLGLLRLTGAGNHPEMVSFLNKVAAALPSEGTPVSGQPTSTGEKTLADRLFPASE